MSTSRQLLCTITPMPSVTTHEPHAHQSLHRHATRQLLHTTTPISHHSLELPVLKEAGAA
jgi:hypothetical protein